MSRVPYIKHSRATKTRCQLRDLFVVPNMKSIICPVAYLNYVKKSRQKLLLLLFYYNNNGFSKVMNNNQLLLFPLVAEWTRIYSHKKSIISAK